MSSKGRASTKIGHDQHSFIRSEGTDHGCKRPTEGVGRECIQIEETRKEINKDREGEGGKVINGDNEMQVRESQGDKLKALMESKGEGRITSLGKG